MEPEIRNLALEKQLCGAIQRHRVVRLKYADDPLWRTFQPQAVYESTVGHINVTGIQTRNDADLMQTEPEPRNFELARIVAVEVTDEEFDFDPAFDASEERFAQGLICLIHPLKLD